MLQAGRVLYFVTILGLAVTGYSQTFGDLIARPLEGEVCERIPGSLYETKTIPTGAIWKHETIREEKAPKNFTAALAWINAVTVTPCARENGLALVEIKKITLIEKDTKDDSEKVLKEFVYDNDERKDFEGSLFQREPYWFGPGEGKIASSILSHTKDGLVINLKQISHNIYHGWTNPRVSLQPDKKVIVEMEVRISGEARVQLGVDYWKDITSDYNGYDPNCQVSNNCEAWIGDWYGDTNGKYITIRSPQKFDK